MSNANLPKAELKELAEKLAGFDRFAGCSKGDLEHLAKASTLTAVPASWALINEQTPSDACYVILDGEVEVRVDAKPVAQLGAGAVVGEVGLLTSRLRNATVFSVTRVTLLHLVPEVFHELVSASQALRDALQGPTMADPES
ncbi:MAG TPA: cyclic nucleotide-binding domain-containing protein [Mycobacteriales bacterium]|jgi:CRP-like cAMP-binding protein|nr:cyclic nucleotide-binding domain-containing protein [Mycobacteriales bacterium]